MKKCARCKESKNEELFYRTKRHKDGLQSYCKSCSNELHAAYSKTDRGKLSLEKTRRSPGERVRQRRYWQSEKGKAKAKTIRQTEKYKRAHYASNKRYRARHPNKQKALQAVQNEIETGRMPPASFWLCRKCWDRNADHYHHWSYEPENWIKVIPVCKQCHAEIHNS